MDIKRNILPLTLLGLAILFISFGAYQLNKMPASRYPDIHGKFSLLSADGPVTSDQMRGKVGVIYFGYTHCPDVCPDTLLRIGAALNQLNEEELSKVMPVFITTDPARDTPELMATYARHFDSHLLGLSGSEQAIATAAKSFLTGYQKASPDTKGNYTVSHASFIIIVRPDGDIAEFMTHTSPPEKIAETIRYWLRWT